MTQNEALETWVIDFNTVKESKALETGGDSFSVVKQRSYFCAVKQRKSCQCCDTK